jgi:hypothetical protein
MMAGATDSGEDHLKGSHGTNALAIAQGHTVLSGGNFALAPPKLYLHPNLLALWL